MRKVLILASVLTTVLIAGCEASRIPGVHRIDVPQGNVVTPEQVARLEPGMEQRKVRFILGSPLLVDVFNQERWDYVYEYRPGSVFAEPVHRRVSLFFENTLLSRIEGNIEPATAEELDAPREQVVSVPDTQSNDGFFSSLNPFGDDEKGRSALETGPVAPGSSSLDSAAESSIRDDAAARTAPRESSGKPPARPIPDANKPAAPAE